MHDYPLFTPFENTPVSVMTAETGVFCTAFSFANGQPCYESDVSGERSA